MDVVEQIRVSVVGGEFPQLLYTRIGELNDSEKQAALRKRCRRLATKSAKRHENLCPQCDWFLTKPMNYRIFINFLKMTVAIVHVNRKARF